MLIFFCRYNYGWIRDRLLIFMKKPVWIYKNKAGAVMKIQDGPVIPGVSKGIVERREQFEKIQSV